MSTKTVAVWVNAFLAMLLHPVLIASAASAVGYSMLVVGVLMLAGPGWALLAASAPCLLIALVLILGLQRDNAS